MKSCGFRDSDFQHENQVEKKQQLLFTLKIAIFYTHCWQIVFNQILR